MQSAGEAAEAPYPRLLGDVGGTHLRLAWVDQQRRSIVPLETLACADFAGLEDAIASCLGRRRLRPASCALAIAAPITGDTVVLTNLGWSFSIASLERRLGLERLVVINDFAALALSIPRLDPHQSLPVGRGRAVAGAAIGVLGPGTGLGVAGLVCTGGGHVALPSEGGHASLSACDAGEDRLLGVLRSWYGHVSFERVLSGPGIVNLYRARCELAGVAAQPHDAAAITLRAAEGSDARCVAAVADFFGFLGSFAGNLALTFDARGGIFIGGGIVPLLGERMASSDFRDRFEAKGRFGDYLAAIPTRVIAHASAAALQGADSALDQPRAAAAA